MTYRLTSDNRFEVEHVAQSDADTVVNLTHHSFFNLARRGRRRRKLARHADKRRQVHPRGRNPDPHGEIAGVEGTPFDFREPHAIGERLGDDDEQLKLGRGYDHNWVVNRKFPEALELAARVFEPESGRELEVYTTEPGMQFYGGNFLNGGNRQERQAVLFQGGVRSGNAALPRQPQPPELPVNAPARGRKILPRLLVQLLGEVSDGRHHIQH